ncbi:MAG: ABC transporter permease [Acidobacteriota bacterium]
MIPFLTQFWMFATPVIYPASLVPEQFRLFYFLNPLSGLIEAWRVVLLGGVNGGRLNWEALGSAAIVAVLLLVYAAYDFRRMERHFADLV